MRLLLLAAAALPALLAGCDGTRNRGLESVHQPVVDRAEFALDVSAGPDGLAPGEGQRLTGWFRSMGVGYGDRIAVDDPMGSVAVRDDVAAAAARHGLLLTGDAPVTPAPVAAGTVRVVVSRMRAHVPGCPDWSRAKGHDAEGHSSSNYGCASNTNLAAMVANPADLVRGEPGVGYDPMQGTKAIDSWRKAVPTGAGGTVVKSDGTGGK